MGSEFNFLFLPFNHGIIPQGAAAHVALSIPLSTASAHLNSSNGTCALGEYNWCAIKAFRIAKFRNTSNYIVLGLLGTDGEKKNMGNPIISLDRWGTCAETKLWCMQPNKATIWRKSTICTVQYCEESRHKKCEKKKAPLTLFFPLLATAQATVIYFGVIVAFGVSACKLI